VDTTDSTAPAHPPTDEERSCFVCYEGWVYLGFETEQDGELVEITDRVPCRRCVTEAPVR
jgi:hypothetical protein